MLWPFPWSDNKKGEFSIKSINGYMMRMLIIISILKPCVLVPSLTIASSSQLIGLNVNMTITISNPSIPSYILIDYGDWGNGKMPNSSATQYLFSSGIYYDKYSMSCTAPIGKFMRCITPSAPFGNSIILTITNVLNPSSTKPYQIKITLGYSVSPFEIPLVATLTVNQVQSSSVSISGYNSSIGA